MNYKVLFFLILANIVYGKDLFGTFDNGKKNFKYSDGKLNIYQEAQKKLTLKIPDNYDVKGIVIQNNLSNILIQNGNEIVVYNQTTKQFKQTNIKFSQRITAGYSSNRNLFFIGDATGNIYLLENSNLNYEIKLFLKSETGFSVKGINKVGKKNFFIEWQKNLNKNVGFNYSNDLLGDRIVERKVLGYRSNISVLKDEKTAVLGSNIGFIKKVETIRYTENVKNLAKVSQSSIFQITPNGLLEILSFDDRIVKYLPNDIIVVANKVEGRTTIVDMKKLLQNGNLDEASTILNKYYNFIEFNESGIALANPSTKVVEIYDLKKNVIKKLGLKSPVQGLVPGADGFYTVLNSGSIDFVYLSGNSVATHNYIETDFKFARNIDYKRVGNNIYMIKSNGSRLSVFMPNKCLDIFKI